MLLILNLYASQYLGQKGLVQVDRMIGLNRLIGHRLKRHGSARVVEENFAGRAGRAAGGNDYTEEGQQDADQRNRET